MTYPTESLPAGLGGGRIASVAPGSPAERAGLAAGSIITSVAGAPLRDLIDWMWYSDGPTLTLHALGPSGSSEVLLERAWPEGWGIEFEGVVFDGVRECENACAFCFVEQLPPGLRPALHVRDDDYRLSFLVGNFVTLTNLDDTDIDRIIGMRLSPLHVSLHAVDPRVRSTLMCPTAEDRTLEHIDTLLEAGIEMHVQIVAVPGVNDGPVLTETLEWLAVRSGILSVGVVPVGVTRYQHRIAERYDAPESIAAVLETLRPWSERMQRERGSHWVYAADEFYLTGGADLPVYEDYDEFPQFENGIGMTRAFIDECADALDGMPQSARSGSPREVVLVTGELFAPVLDFLRPELANCGVELRILPVRNDLLGGNVNVAGLLAGRDVLRSIVRDGAYGAVYLVPDLTVNDRGLMLDDLTIEDVAAAADADVRLVESDAAGLVSALAAISSTPR